MLRRMMLVSVILAMSVCTIDAQNAAKNWIFGRGARIDFNPNTPTPTVVTTINTIEGSSSISDSTGVLKFSTDGLTVWDKNNNLPMTNGTGLLGSPSSTHSALIVPCSCEKYFIFTTDAVENQYNNGLRYSVVDMTQSGGLGAVTSKNNILLLKASEKIAGVSDGSGGYWVVGHKMGTNEFFSYHIVANSDCSLNPRSAVISPVGAIFSGGNADFGQGQMKISPDGKLLAHAGLNYQNFAPGSFVEIFQFNTSTGVVSNLGTATAHDSSIDGFYGIEFSPDSNTLYATTMVTNNFIYRYGNITANRLTSRTTINSFGNSQYAVAALQLASDGKIYVARKNYPSLYVLPAPNTANGGWTGIPFNLAAGSLSQLGLPTMVPGDFSCGPTPDVDACCPPWNTNLLADTLVYQRSGSISAPYTLKFQPSSAFDSQMQTYIDYLHSRNSNITEITIAWRLHDQTGITTGWGPQISPTAYTKWTAGGNGNPAIWPTTGFFTPPAYPAFPMQVGRSYAVTTGMYLEKREHFFPDTCANVTIFVRIQVTTATPRGGPVLEFSDGKKGIKSVSIGGMKQQER